MREIVLDTETTGLDPKLGHRIVEIGAIELFNKISTGKHFHYYINPQRDMPEEAYKIHGISAEFLADKPLFKDIADELLDFIKDSQMVIHNSKFDIGFLNHELNLLGKPLFEMEQSIDTLQMARKMFPGARANLDALCRRFKIDNSNRELHGALKDSELLAEVYLELCGGRQNSFMFNINNSTKQHNADVIHTKSDNMNNIKHDLVIRANEQENNLHDAMLKSLINKN